MKNFAWGAAAIIAGLLSATAAQAIHTPTVATGWNLWHTVPGTSFLGIPLQGVNLGTYDFGAGLVSVGNADTIVYRWQPATVPPFPPPPPPPVPQVAPPIVIELVALQLITVNPIDLGAGFGDYYVTLSSAHRSWGTMTITFFQDPEVVVPGQYGTFTSTLDVYFDVRFGCLTCAIVFSTNKILANDEPIPWMRLPTPGDVEIDFVNRYLIGIPGDRSQDFWPGCGRPRCVLVEPAPDAVHKVVVAFVPEPASWAMMIAGFGLVGGALRRRQHQTVTVQA